MGDVNHQMGTSVQLFNGLPSAFIKGLRTVQHGWTFPQDRQRSRRRGSGPEGLLFGFQKNEMKKERTLYKTNRKPN